VVEGMVLVGSAQSELSPHREVTLKEITALPLILPISAVMKEVESGLLKYAPIENTNTRTLVLANAKHPNRSRLMGKVSEIIQDVIVGLYQNERIFGDMKISGPGDPKARKLHVIQ